MNAAVGTEVADRGSHMVRRVIEQAQEYVALGILAGGLMLSTIASHGPSWQHIAAAAGGGLAAVTLGSVGYFVRAQEERDSKQDDAIQVNADKYVLEATARQALEVQLESMKKENAYVMNGLQDQIRYERERREKREEEERDELRKLKGK